MTLKIVFTNVRQEMIEFLTLEAYFQSIECISLFWKIHDHI